MDTKRVDQVNILLMLMSAFFAYLLPFQLFLFAYAVLGPLHYLTEIGWLREKRYFTNSKSDPMLLIGGGIALFLVGVIPSAGDIVVKLLIGIFCAALLMTIPMSEGKKFGAIGAVVLSLALIPILPPLLVLFAIFLPTLIHVYVFTGGFMLYGALKGKSESGLWALLAYVAIPLLLVLFSLHSSPSLLSDYVRSAYAFMAPLNQAILSLIHAGDGNIATAVFYSSAGIALMKFIAFAYTYHYLNWFSKTKVIKWHLVPKNHLAIVLLLWIGAVALYGYNYQLGMFTLGFLSMLHVLLEFPLNHRTFYGIGTELKARYAARLLTRA